MTGEHCSSSPALSLLKKRGLHNSHFKKKKKNPKPNPPMLPIKLIITGRLTRSWGSSRLSPCWWCRYQRPTFLPLFIIIIFFFISTLVYSTLLYFILFYFILFHFDNTSMIPWINYICCLTVIYIYAQSSVRRRTPFRKLELLLSFLFLSKFPRWSRTKLAKKKKSYLSNTGL